MPENQEIREWKKDSSFPKDLLQRFMCGGGERHFPANPKGESPENVELSLGLSLNGRFGVEPKRLEANNKLFRASSVANFLTFPAAADDPAPFLLTRTCSLPVETEEWRKRKELQSLRRSEAKKRRFEKLKNVRVVKRKPAEDWGSNKNGMESKGSQPVPAASLLPPPPQFSSQGSVGSEGSGESSGVSEFESQLSSGTNKDTEVKRSPADEPHAPHRAPTRPTKPSPSRTGSYNPSASSSRVANTTRLENSSSRSAQSLPESSFRARPDDDTFRVLSGDMRCVSTKGDGPEGKKVDGFLYRYKKGEVRIVCVCHGSFLTPAEFVKHAGGGDVEHPLRRIIVNPPSIW